jgi:hypothetical protein
LTCLVKVCLVRMSQKAKHSVEIVVVIGFSNLDADFAIPLKITVSKKDNRVVMTILQIRGSDKISRYWWVLSGFLKCFLKHR